MGPVLRDVEPCTRSCFTVFVAILAVAVAMVRARLKQQPGPRWTSPLWLLPLWLVTASVTFASGGQFFPHYWVILAAPVAVSTAVAVASWRSSVGVVALGAFAILPAVGTTIAIAILPRDRVPSWSRIHTVGEGGGGRSMVRPRAPTR